MIAAKDISQYQGNWQDTGEQIVMIKMSGGDAGLYFDSKASQDYTGAKAAGRHVGGYHFVGWTEGAVQEASWFVRAMSPVAENDVFALDIEKGSVAVPGNAVQYTLDMVNYIHDKLGVYPLVYMNLSTLNQFDWSRVLAVCGLWLADWAVSPNDNIPTGHAYVMQQYSDGPNYDHDEWFPSLEVFDKYGYHSAPATTTTTTTQAAPEPTTTTTTVATPAPPEPDPTTTTTTTEAPLPPPFTTTSTTTTTTVNPSPNPDLPAKGLFAAIVAFFVGIWKWLRNGQ